MEDLGIGDVVMGVADAATSGMTAGGKNGPDGGCLVILLILVLVGAPLLLITKCVGEPPEVKIIRKVSEFVSPQPATHDQPKKESIPHWMGRKTKDSVIDFGKGIIGK